jgi:hypothetical protein
MTNPPLVLALLLSIASLSLRADAQDAAPARSGAVRLLIDCVDTFCDQDFFRTEVTFVDHVRERQDADVHLLVTSESTGSGGREITFSFFGQGRFAKRDHVMRYAVVVAESDDAVRREMVRTISLGLVPYAIDSSAVDTLAVVSLPRPGPTAQGRSDPWNRWTFRTQLSGNGNGERSNQFSNVSGSFGANRVTQEMKLTLSTSGSFNESRFRLPDGRDFASPNRRFGANAVFVQSMGGHWSAGVRTSLSSTTFENLDRGWYLAPAIEYDVFPYSESTRRLLTVQYAAGLRSFDYREETLFGKLSEQTAAHILTASLTLSQRWGAVGAGLDGASFVPEVKRNRASAWGDLDLNLFKGLSLSLSGEWRSVRDQVYLPRGEATTEEILVRQRQLATGYQYFYSFGISYTFGSIYSPAVNPRFARGGF